MRFRVDRDVLADAVTWTARSLPTRPPVPVLAGVRLEADTTGTVQLSSFDYEVSARSQIPADVSEAGTVLVSGRLLAEISRALPDKPVDVVLDGTKVVVTCGASRFTLLTMPVEDYPNLPVMPPTTGHRRRRRAHARGRPGVRRRQPRRHVAAAHGRAGRDRGREGHAPGHRPLPARAARAHVEAVVARTSRRSRSCVPARCPTPRSRSAAPARSRWRCPPARAST